MELKKGDMFSRKNIEPIFFTANSVVTKDGRLVMGAGAALDAKKAFPNSDKDFGALVKAYGIKTDNGLRFGVLWSRKRMLGAFQTKYHWKENSDMDLIFYAAIMLSGFSRRVGMLNVNFPGINYGGLQRSEVLEVIQDIWKTDPIVVWEK